MNMPDGDSVTLNHGTRPKKHPMKLKSTEGDLKKNR